MATPKPDHDHHLDHDNDNSKQREHQGGAVTPTPAGGAMTSLAALGAALNTVDTASVGGRLGLPMLSFNREGDGTWMYGQRKIVVEAESRWGVNPLSFQYGYICFGANKKVLGERLAPVNRPMPDAANTA